MIEEEYTNLKKGDKVKFLGKGYGYEFVGEHAEFVFDKKTEFVVITSFPPSVEKTYFISNFDLA